MRKDTSRRSAALAACALALTVAGSTVPSVSSAAIGTPPEAQRIAQRTPAEANPLANRTWGVYKGSGDQAWTPYQRAKGARKQLLAKIALAPKAKWYGQWIPTNQVQGKVRD